MPKNAARNNGLLLNKTSEYVLVYRSLTFCRPENQNQVLWQTDLEKTQMKFCKMRQNLTSEKEIQYIFGNYNM